MLKKFSVRELNEAFVFMGKSLAVFEKQDADDERF